MLMLGTHPATRIDIRRHGAKGDGTTDDTTAVQDWIEECTSLQIPGWAPPGVYLIDRYVTLELDRQLTLHTAPGAIIKGEGGSASPVVRFDGVVGSDAAVTLINLTIDNSLRTYIANEGSGSALILRYLRRFTVRGCEFIAADDWRDELGDAGIDYGGCGHGVIDDCLFIGQPDTAIYGNGPIGTDDVPQGTLTLDAYGDVSVTNSRFYRCRFAGTHKRNERRVTYQGNHIVDCRGGIANLGITPDVGLEAFNTPAHEMIVTGNYFKRTATRAAQMFPESFIFAHNIVEDWGDITVAGPVNAVEVHGVGGVINNNIFRFSEWDGYQSQKCIRLMPTTSAGVDYTPHHNRMYNNIMQDVQFGVYEDIGTYGNRGSFTCFNVTTPVTLPTDGSSDSFYELSLG